jgi:hypothetical protein
MWPYSTNSSRVMGVRANPKIHINLDDFAKGDKVLEATLTSDIWAMVEWLSVTTDSTNIDVIKALLFQALYGRIAYEQLLAHVGQQSIDTEEDDEYEVDALFKLYTAIPEQEQKVTVVTHNDDQIRKSPERGTPADLKHIGKSNVRRKFEIPHRMWIDLDRQAAKAGKDLSPYVRGLLFKVLQGEVNYNQWQHARAELENKPRP